MGKNVPSSSSYYASSSQQQAPAYSRGGDYLADKMTGLRLVVCISPAYLHFLKRLNLTLNDEQQEPYREDRPKTSQQIVGVKWSSQYKTYSYPR